MMQDFESVENRLDADGNPAGGHVRAPGLKINWQDGPLGRGDDRREPNGSFVETVIAAAAQRIAFYQDGRFACLENQAALEHLEAALDVLNHRTERREAAGTEGTHEGT